MEIRKSHKEELIEESRYIIIGLLLGYLVRFLARQAIKYIEKQPKILNSDKSNESNPSISKPFENPDYQEASGRCSSNPANITASKLSGS